jgi:hypothetical protein
MQKKKKVNHGKMMHENRDEVHEYLVRILGQKETSIV